MSHLLDAYMDIPVTVVAPQRPPPTTTPNQAVQSSTTKVATWTTKPEPRECSQRLPLHFKTKRTPLGSHVQLPGYRSCPVVDHGVNPTISGDTLRRPEITFQ